MSHVSRFVKKIKNKGSFFATSDLRHGTSRDKSSGFTLVELLVSISIFTAITTLSVIGHSNFNGSIILTNLAYEIGLSIRQAQVYGITVKGTSADPRLFTSGYGMRFDKSVPSKYFLFEDKDRDHMCDPAECGTGYADVLETFYIQKGNKLLGVCLDDTDCSQTTVDISFVRPNPDAYITDSTGTRYGKAEVCVASPVTGALRRIIVEETGQISVSTDPGPNCINLPI